MLLIVPLLILLLGPSAFAKQRQADQRPQGREVQSSDSTGDSLPAAAETGPAPKIFFSESTHDFDTTKQKTSLTHIFKVQNIGDAPLTIISAKAS